MVTRQRSHDIELNALDAGHAVAVPGPVSDVGGVDVDLHDVTGSLDARP